jgi:uncharacterized protein (DUF2249 family)
MSNFTTIIDIRTYPPGNRRPVITGAYEELKSGERLELINDHDPKPLYQYFRAEYEGKFEWEYLEQGTEIWRISIGKK